MQKIDINAALQAHPEFLNEKIDDHDKAIYAKGWNDCNKEYYNAISGLPVASIDCTDLSMRLRRAFEADELVNQRILLDAADAIEELLAAVPHWVSVEEQLPTAEDGDPWDRCIVYTDEDTIQTLPLCKVGNGYVTHWMKVEPPKEVE